MKGAGAFNPKFSQYKLINAGVANIYSDATFLSSVVTQGILGESVEVIAQQDDWLRIRQWDDYEGWIYHFSVTESPADWDPDYTYSGAIGWIYREPSLTSAPVRQICAGVRLPGSPVQGDWLEVRLPDGVRGYLPAPPAATGGGTLREAIPATAERFLGVSYVWGGKTGFGFDCSGFVQTVFWLNGESLPRDAWQQAEQAHRLTGRRELQPGDLVFFTTGERINHVGIAYDPDRFIHCSGRVRISSFDASAPEYDHRLAGLFRGAGRVIQDC